MNISTWLLWLATDPWGTFTFSMVALMVALLSLIGNVIIYRKLG